MTADELEIRKLVVDWIAATRTGDIAGILELMTEDVVFLTPGQAPMHKPEFIAAARAHAGDHAPTFDATSEVVEVQVVGEWAYMWTRLSVVITPVGANAMKRSGHTLSVLRKEHGRWRIARDANLLGPPGPL